MRIGMVVPLALQAGFALAATIARDSGAKHAHVGLAPDVSDAWCGLARDLERLSKAERRQRIRELVRLPRVAAAPLRGVVQPLRELREPARTRPGYAPSPVLLALLSRIEQRSGR